MNYIDLINKAWELREQGILTMHEHDLFNYLVHKCNKLNWKNSFSQSTKIICAVLGINRNMLTHRRKRLKQLGLIDFKEGLTKVKPAEYTICNLKETPVYEQDKTNKKSEPTKKNKEKNVKKNRFEKPTIEEISLYCSERKNEVDAHQFFDFYQSKDWMIGKNKMKDWRAAVRSWEIKQRNVKHPFTKHAKDKRYEMF
ncbi:MAG: hypothetical protein E6767_16265 [Dysgonomonas sp.]|nr:hypothetical protein [Dysgonomonas sp.]